MFQMQLPCETYNQAQTLLKIVRRPFPNQQGYMLLSNGVALFDLRR